MSSLDLSLQMTSPPESWVHLRTNCIGSLSKSISSKESHAPRSGIRYFSPIVSAIYVRTSYLSTSCVYSGFRSWSFSHWIFSLKVLGFFKSGQRPIFSLKHNFKYKESGIQRKKPLRLKMEKILIGFKIKCLIFIQKPSYRWKFNLAICEDDFSKAAPKHCFDNASIRSAAVVR